MVDEATARKIDPLSARGYDENYYREHSEAGLDYLGHGFWQQSYGLMVAEATLQRENYAEPIIFDAGCACGSILQGFKESGVFARVIGMDVSEYMVGLGRAHYGLSAEELILGSLADIPLPAESVTLVHSAQVLEHVPSDLTKPILDEFTRILRPGGRAFLCLDAIRHGETKEMYLGDPTHVNIQPVLYWTEQLQRRGLLFDIEAYNRFVSSPRGPTEGDPRSFFATYPYWSVWTLIKGRAN